MDNLRQSAEQILSALEEHDWISMEQLQPAPRATDITPPTKDEDQGTRRKRRSRLAANQR